MSVRGRISGNKSGTAEHSALSLNKRDKALFWYISEEGGTDYFRQVNSKNDRDSTERPVKAMIDVLMKKEGNDYGRTRQ